MKSEDTGALTALASDGSASTPTARTSPTCTVSRGDPLYRVHAEYGSDLAFAREWAAHDSGYTTGEPGEPLREFSEF